jgi:hypothetical protein
MPASAPFADRESDGAAITRVLRAEQEGEERILEAQRQAQALLTRARSRAAEIGTRADRRITTLNARCREVTARTIRAIAEETNREIHLAERPVSDHALHAAVAATARWLLGAGAEP